MSGSPSVSYLLPAKAGNGPRCVARSMDAWSDSSRMNAISVRPISIAWSLSYGTPSVTSMSAKPITPRPILRVKCAISSMAGTAYLLASMTLSRRWTLNRVTLRRWP